MKTLSTLFIFLALTISSVLLSAENDADSIFNGGPETVEKLRKTIIYFYVTQKGLVKTLTNLTPRTGGQGTGFLIGNEGYILTAYHVISPFPDKIYASFEGNKRVAVQFIAGDLKTDIALLKTSEPVGIEGLEFSTKETQVGQRVIAIGNPKGQESTLTSGVVSTIHRVFDNSYNDIMDLTQIDAAINPGNSGGPLFDRDGKLIGIIVSKFSTAQGISFAQSSTLLKKVYLALKDTTQSPLFPFLGLYLQERTPAALEANWINNLDGEGLTVLGVAKESPAALAGLDFGDCLIKIGDKKISTLWEYENAVLNLDIGSEVKLEVLRGNETKLVNVTAGTRPETPRLDPKTFFRIFTWTETAKKEGSPYYSITKIYGGKNAYTNAQVGDTLEILEPFGPFPLPELIKTDDQIECLMNEFLPLYDGALVGCALTPFSSEHRARKPMYLIKSPHFFVH